jgi:hypothetical protein
MILIPNLLGFLKDGAIIKHITPLTVFNQTKKSVTFAQWYFISGVHLFVAHKHTGPALHK